jgi:hypothetical protein
VRESAAAFAGLDDAEHEWRDAGVGSVECCAEALAFTDPFTQRREGLAPARGRGLLERYKCSIQREAGVEENCERSETHSEIAGPKPPATTVPIIRAFNADGQQSP